MISSFLSSSAASMRAGLSVGTAKQGVVLLGTMG